MTKGNVASDEPVTVLFNMTVHQGKENEFETLMHELHKAARTFPGHMGVTTLKNPASTGGRQTVLRFDNEQHLQDWLSSPIRKKLMQHINEIADSENYREATGLETWFDIPGQRVTPPPRWKMVIATFIAIYPLSLIYGFFIAPNTLSWPTPVRALILPIGAPIILTYLFMPFLSQRVLKRWLYRVSS